MPLNGHETLRNDREYTITQISVLFVIGIVEKSFIMIKSLKICGSLRHGGMN